MGEKLSKQETEIERLNRIVGTQSVMLHDLQEKIKSLVAFDGLTGEPTQTWEILRMLADWTQECDLLMKEETDKLGITPGIDNAEPGKSG